MAPVLARSIGRMERKCLARMERMGREFKAKGYRFSKPRAEEAVKFIEKFCKHYKGEWAGQPMLLELWQKRCIHFVFGWLLPSGHRVIRTMWIEVARKNGKSQLAAAIGCYLLIADNEPGAEIYSSATMRDQAKIVWNAARMIIKQNPVLSKFVKPQQGQIWVDRTSSKFVPLSADAKTLDGLDPHGNIVDEVHAHRNREVWDVLDTAMGARRQPLTVVITTAGVYDPEQIGWQQHDYATSLVDGIIEDETWFVLICCADEDVAWDSEEAMQQANPNWGVSVKPSYLRTQRDKAQKQASFTNTYKRLHLNLWTAALTLWLNIDQWKACGGELPDREYLKTLPCWAGLDLSTKIDLTAVSFAFYDAEPDLWYLLLHFFLPGDDVHERSKEDKVPYDRWAEQGWITLTDGNVIDYEWILDTVLDEADAFDLQEVAYDPWNCEQTAMKLEAEGVEVVAMRQGFATMSEPCKEFEKCVVGNSLRHGDNPVLTWMANNTTVLRDPSDNLRVDKKASRKRIDGIPASIMAMGRGIVSVDTGSDLEERGGLLILG